MWVVFWSAGPAVAVRSAQLSSWVLGSESKKRLQVARPVEGGKHPLMLDWSRHVQASYPVTYRTRRRMVESGPGLAGWHSDLVRRGAASPGECLNWFVACLSGLTRW